MNRKWPLRLLRLATAAMIAALCNPIACALGDADAESPHVAFHRLPLDGMLSQNSITCMLQDRSGLMWFGTLAGVNVYDGYRFRHLSNDPRDPNALGGVDITRMMEDRDGNVWIAGSFGAVGWLDRLDPRSGRVEHLPRELFGTPDRPGSAAVALHQAPDGAIWIGTNTGLHRYDPATRELRIHADGSLGAVSDIVADSDGRLWIAAPDGVYRYDPARGRLEAFHHDPADPRSLGAPGATKLLLAADGSLWVGTRRGLDRREPGRAGFTHYRHDPTDPASLGGDDVRGLSQDSHGRIWIGTQAGGLSRFAEGRFDVFVNDPDDVTTLSFNDVWSIYEDRSGLIWIGTAGGGLNQINPSTDRFQALRSIPFNPNSLRNPMIWDLQEDAAGVVWMATLAGLERFDPRTGKYAHFAPTRDDTGMNQLQSVLIDRTGRIFVGSVNGHLYRFSPDTATFTNITRDGAPSGAFSADRIWYFGQDADGRAWVAVDEGLFALDASSDAIVETIPASRSIPMGIAPVRASLTDSDGTLWFGGGGVGLIRYQRGRGVVGTLGMERGQAGALSNNLVRALYESPDGDLWVGTHNGLNRMTNEDRRAGRNRFALYTEADGLPDNTVYGILPDGDGRHLWLSTNAGLSRFDSKLGTSRSFTVRDGLAANEMNGGAELVASDGRLYFGTVNGVSFFRPQSMSYNQYVPPVRITRIDRHDSGDRSESARIFESARQLAFDYDRVALSLDFAAMDFHQPSKNRFRYRLLGPQGGDWVDTDRPSVDFATLPPADYRFEVLASNNDGVWSTAPATLAISVRPPWWRTTWAYALYTLAVAMLLLGYHAIHRRKLERERQFSESLASARSLAEANHQMALRHAQFDETTQLPNRASLMDTLARYMRLARTQQRKLALLLINLDKFQRVNDTVGYKSGDQILRSTGERMQRASAENDFLARVGSDEFALVALCPAGVDESAWLAAATARLNRAIGEPHLEHEPPVRMSASIGAAFYVGSDETPGDLLSFANMALHAAKRDAGRQVQRYVTGMIESARERLSIEGRMRRALDVGEFVLHYQPQVDAANGRLTGFEALVRWQTPDQGLLLPGRFIAIAEELGLIVELGRWVLNAACRQAREWLDAGHTDFSIAVNVSPLQLHHPGFVEEVRDALARHALPRGVIELELTESAIMDSIEQAATMMAVLKGLGVAITLDDFGVGHSSLSTLKRLPIDKLKIDQSFVKDVIENSDDAAIVRAIVAMGHQLQLEVLAEGVETQSQLGYLRRSHCDQCQGWFFGAAQPQAAAEVILRQRYLNVEAFAATRPTQTLLLLDDEENVRHALTRLLRRDGFRILSAGSASEAFAMLGREEVQVVIADQRMPEMSGTEFLNRVKEMYPGTVRLILSGYTDLATVTDAINRGAIYKFLTKPWDDADLRAQICDAFRMHGGQGEVRH